VTVRNDPRSRATPAALGAQVALVRKLTTGLDAAWDGHRRASALRDAVKQSASGASADVASAATALAAALDSIAGNPGAARGFAAFGGRPGAAPPTFVAISGALVRQLEAQDYADMAPTPSMLAAYAQTCRDLHTALATWTRVVTHDLPALNALLGRSGRSAVGGSPSPITAPTC
jgi:hypothetical protein